MTWTEYLAEANGLCVFATADGDGEIARTISRLASSDVRLTYTELGDQLNQAARAHIATGLEKGDRF